MPNVSQSIQDPGSESTTSTPEPGAKERENSNESTTTTSSSNKQEDVRTGGLSVKTKTELLEQRRLNLPVSTPDFKIGMFSLFRNRRFMIDEMTLRKASKFVIFLQYENLCTT